mmetsp:Transcript_125937/g.403190  ORF Transcript_125937/g.403190 Transcript_125937/m.403190 type:complete len:1125 (-) Transcript_125937:64-3438(-)
MMRWDAICITARVPAHAEAYKHELSRRRGAVALAPDALVLAVADPGDAPWLPTAGRIGSGGATLNALLLVAEHLSALAGDNNVDMTVLRGKRVLVLHVGGANQRTPAFSLLPSPDRPDAGGGVACLALSTIELLLDGLTSLARSCAPGLFIVSSEDSFVRVGDAFCSRFAAAAATASPNAAGGTATAVAMALPVGEVSNKHGAYELAEGGAVRRLLYRASEEELCHVRLPARTGDGDAKEDERAAKVCGVVYFDEVAATRLLNLAFDPAFERCSYLGIDNGAKPRGFSLFLDLLACLGSEASLEEFGQSTSLAGQVHVESSMRLELWRRLHGEIALRAVVVEADDPSQYMSVRSVQDYARLVALLGASRPLAGSSPDVATTRTSSGAEGGVGQGAFLVNSVLKACTVGPGAIIENCSLESCEVAAGAVCSNVKRVRGVSVPARLSLQQVSLLSSASAGFAEGLQCVVAFALSDEAKLGDLDGTFLGRSWMDLQRRTGIGPADLWGSDGAGVRTPRTAKLFPVVLDLKASSLGFLWSEYETACQQASTARIDLWRRRWVQAWREARRLTLDEVLMHADVAAELEWQDTVMAETNVLRAKQLMLYHRDLPLKHILDDEVRRNRWGLLDVLDEVAAADETPLDVAARALAQIAEVLAAFGGPAGGLRSGSARNPQWRGALQRLASPETSARRAAILEMRRLRTEWIGDGPVALIRAARHYEAAAQVLILMGVATCSEFISIVPSQQPRPPGQWVVVEAPARIDLAGGWTDTPPVCYEHGGCVVNLALFVDGKRPIGAKARRLPDVTTLVFETWKEGPQGAADFGAEGSASIVCRSLADLDDHNSPGAAAALLKCCVLCCGIVSIAAGAPPLEEQLRLAGGGLHVASWSTLPQGSGLGSSSILAGVVMKAILMAFGLDMDEVSLIHAVQNVEQMLTTGGGWQDQVGALIGGAKITRSAARLPLHVVPERLPLEEGFAKELASRLVLVFTGRPRLAKHLLQNVIRQWFSRMPEICETVRGLVANAEDAAKALTNRDLSRLGTCMSTYWRQKKVMAPGSEPTSVAALRERLEPGILGFSLAGAGGGGFAMVLTREPEAHGWVREVVEGCPGMESAYVSRVCIDFEGMTVS